ncbi:MAG TPA: hypothetical protein P5525_23695, partial [Candidatus Paceibacterota bacterium]|nr:hypothetical protein [Candidatus Paceibacterota bacterium]
MNRRTFLSGAAASAAAFTMVPRHVLRGAGHVAPSEKFNICLIGCGTMARPLSRRATPSGGLRDSSRAVPRMPTSVSCSRG